MVDLPDLSGAAAMVALDCDRAIFTSLPSRTGEGYRLVAWSSGLRAEERQELTRRTPSHGSLVGDGDSARGSILFRLQSTGRAGFGFARVAGAEHTRRGGGRVWTDLLIADSLQAASACLHPQELMAAIAAEPAPKQPLGSSSLPCVGVAHSGSGPLSARAARASTAVAAAASLLAAATPCVIAAGASAAEMFDDALRMLPRALRGGIEACGGLRFSPSRGVRATVTDRIDQDTIRHTRGQGVQLVDLESKPPAVAGALAPWFALMARWWSEERGAEAVQLADRLGARWRLDDILSVAEFCEAIDRGDESAEALETFLMRRTAA